MCWCDGTRTLHPPPLTIKYVLSPLLASCVGAARHLYCRLEVALGAVPWVPCSVLLLVLYLVPGLRGEIRPVPGLARTTLLSERDATCRTPLLSPVLRGDVRPVPETGGKVRAPPLTRRAENRETPAVANRPRTGIGQRRGGLAWAVTPEGRVQCSPSTLTGKLPARLGMSRHVASRSFLFFWAVRPA